MIAHSGIPNAPYFLLVILPGYLYLWKDNDSLSLNKAPDYEIEAQGILRPYLEQLQFPLEKASEFHLESIVTAWLKDIVSAKQLTDPSLTWLQDSGLFKAITKGSVVMQAPIAA